ncbi:dTDP-4-dehydrorhamnose reductase family protein [Rhizobium helianthi]|uniref:dTDP-4-dehydrorhamnose reductase n=1 Tax=Rhizobium helianthi TaxID=1132695 RepID=A0ABW4M167_9HYPH
MSTESPHTPPLQRILVLGASGLLGQAVLRELAQRPGLHALAASRTRQSWQEHPHCQPLICGDLRELQALSALLEQARPDIVINCVSVPKELWNDWPTMIGLFAALPRRLAHFATMMNFRLIHISTDGVFSGRTGGYREEDLPDAEDPYGLAKQLGETQNGRVTTLRTSIIGPDPSGRRGLLEWVLQQKETCRGFSRAIFSGLPTTELARLIMDDIVPAKVPAGLYHVAAEPISKADLARLIIRQYGLPLEVADDPSVEIDRSLNASRLRELTGYVPAEWPVLIEKMHSNHMQWAGNHV